MQTPSFDFEKSLIPSNTRYLLGIDEVGRGPLAGPVTIGAFLLDLSTFDPEIFQRLKVRDSKKLSSSQRLKIVDYFIAHNFDFRTYSATSSEIDHKGIAVCIYQLITKALTSYRANYDFCLIDGNYDIDKFPLSSKGVSGSAGQGILSVVHGDSLCYSIAAASIVAKVDRDTQMDSFDVEYPQYGFSSHKGYGTASHLQAIKDFGPCPIHRLSFKPFT